MTRAKLPVALGLVVLVAACSEGEEVSGGGSSITTASAGQSAGTDSGSTTGDTSTTEASSTDGVPTGTDATGSDTTTTGATTTDGTTDGTTGPICDPGAVNCVCDGDTCEPGLSCVDGLCVAGVVCDGDITEPDDDEPSAHDLGEITDDDDQTVMADGVLSGAADLDWFTYHGLDTFGHVAEPTVKVTSSATVRVCQFIECDEGGVVMTEVSCPLGTQTALSGALRPGCCGGATFTISDFNCSGSSDDIRVYVRLDKASQDECVEYSLVAHN